MSMPTEADGWRVVQDPDPFYKHIGWRCRALVIEWNNWGATSCAWCNRWLPKEVAWSPDELAAREAFFAELFLRP